MDWNKIYVPVKDPVSIERRIILFIMALVAFMVVSLRESYQRE